MPHPTARFENPKYFEQSVSDYSDVVPLLQKKTRMQNTLDFLSALLCDRQKEKVSDKSIKRSVGRAEFT